MDIEEFDWGIVVRGIPYTTLNLDKTFDCGQCFRWNKNNNGIWEGIIGDRLIRMRQAILDGESEPVLAVNVNKADWNKIYTYLDLCTDYEIRKEVYEGDSYLKSAIRNGLGIRILRQDFWEALVSFIISQRNNIPKIKSTIDKLCRAFGDKYISNENGVEYEFYSFPSAERLASATDNELRAIGLGYRAPYVLSAARAVSNGDISLAKLNDSIDVISELEELNGVGPKVANCVALFGMHKLDMFPIDIWISRIINDKYNGNLDISRFGKLAGLIQQYMFYNERFI